MKKILSRLIITLGVVISTLIITVYAYPIIQQVSGLAVAASTIAWNNVKDASQGNGLSNGVLVSAPYIYNGTTYDAVTGDTTNGMDVDVTRISLPVLSTTIITGQVSVDTTAGGTSVIASNIGREEVMIQNVGATDVYCGNTGLTITNGFLLQANAVYIDDKFSGAIFCITASGSTTIAYKETN